MKKTTTLACTLVAGLLFGGTLHAQQMEAVYSINYENTARAQAAIDDLFTDDALDGGRVTMYVSDFGNTHSSHVVVVDADNYDDFMARNAARVASHGWSRYQLRTPDAEYLGGMLVSVIADHGAPRHTAGYLVVFNIHTTDAATYASAIADLDDDIGNPGVLRLVAVRSGATDVTHGVLIGGENFAEVAGYLDDMVESDAFDDFLAKVSDIRKVVSVHWYRRVGTWGD